MLIEEGGLRHLRDIKENEQTDPDVLQITAEILDSVDTHIRYYGKPKSLQKPEAKSNG